MNRVLGPLILYLYDMEHPQKSMGKQFGLFFLDGACFGFLKRGPSFLWIMPA